MLRCENRSAAHERGTRSLSPGSGSVAPARFARSSACARGRLGQRASTLWLRCTTRRKSGSRAGPAGTAACRSGARRTCRAAGRTAATAGTAAMSCSSATSRSATSGALSGSRHFRARRGEHGEGSNRHGARGEDREIPVPAGTQATTVDGSAVDLVEAGQRAVVAHGGRGGHGNKRFTTSTRQAPRFAENGTERGGGLDRAAAEAARRRRPGRAAERRQVLAAGAADAGDAEGRRLPVHDALAGPGDDRRGGPPGGRRRHPGADRRARPRAPAWATSSSPTSSAARCSSTWSTWRRSKASRCANYETGPRRSSPRYGAGLEHLPELVAALEARPAPRAERRSRWRSGRVCASGSATTALGVLAVSSATGEGLDELRRRILAELPERCRPRPAAVAAGRSVGRRVRGRAPRLPARRRGRLPGRARGRRRLPRRSAAASSCCSSATT